MKKPLKIALHVEFRRVKDYHKEKDTLACSQMVHYKMETKISLKNREAKFQLD